MPLVLGDNSFGLSRSLSLHTPDLLHLNRIEIDLRFTVSLKGMDMCRLVIIRANHDVISFLPEDSRHCQIITAGLKLTQLFLQPIPWMKELPCFRFACARLGTIIVYPSHKRRE